MCPPPPISSLPPLLLPSLLQERLPQLLHTIILSSSQSHRPSSYVEFTYPRPLKHLDKRQILTAPYLMSWGTKPRCISMWFSVNKYCLEVHST